MTSRQRVRGGTRPSGVGTAPRAKPLPKHGRGYLGLAAIAIAAITFIAYAGAPQNQFVNWDDSLYVTQNPLVLQKDYGSLLRAIVALNYHPLTMLTMAWNAATPISPAPFILTNVALHVVNTLLVFWLVLLLSGRSLLVSSFVALLFGIHPMHVESVAWISERKDVLYACFFFGGLIAYWWHHRHGALGLLVLSFVLFVLSCLSKGMAVVFPLVMVLIDFWERRPFLARRALLEKLPFFAVALLFGAIAVNVQAGGDFHGLLRPSDSGNHAMHSLSEFPWRERMALPTYAYLMYVVRFFAPVGLCAVEPYPAPGQSGLVQLVLGPIFFLASLGVAFWDARRTRLMTFGIGWYVATVALVLQWIPVGVVITADRYAYLPYVGLAFLWAMAVRTAHEKNSQLGVVLWCASGVFLMSLLLQTPRQVKTWRDGDSLWTRTIQVNPNLATSYVYRGTARNDAGRVPEAMADYRAAIELGSRTSDPYVELGRIYGMRGQLDSALTMYDHAVALAPENGHYRYIRGFTYLLLGHPREALTDFDGAVAAGSQDAETFYDRGRARLNLGDRAGAAEDFHRALQLDPAHAGAKAQLTEPGI